MDQLQRKLSNGMWHDENRIDEFLNMAAEHNGISTGAVQAKLDAGEELRLWTEDWYPYIRNKPAPRTRKATAQVQGRVCRGCGGSEFTGAMFTTMPGSSYCDDCF